MIELLSSPVCVAAKPKAAQKSPRKMKLEEELLKPDQT
jgi:hypothetical protein